MYNVEEPINDFDLTLKEIAVKVVDCFNIK